MKLGLYDGSCNIEIYQRCFKEDNLFFNSGFVLKLTPVSVNAIVRRVSKSAENKYENLKNRYCLGSLECI
ncbi:MAG: hypothetical protein B6U87_00255 [Candidatus Aenigmarchaeota archaeon ex4484_52]|nr:MAG: hypothetical protein B6U87_00255 [Candidatus Aenigmarchaeota archaeon ex4484_52]